MRDRRVAYKRRREGQIDRRNGRKRVRGGKEKKKRRHLAQRKR